MIGRWKSLLRSSICCIPLERAEEVKIRFVGSFPRELFDVRSFYNVLVPHVVLISLGKCIWQKKVLLRAACFCLVGCPRKNPHHR
jgi:hypothetical protein